jgi:hypothetical protein
MRNASDGSHILGTLSFVCYISWASFLVRSGIRVFIATRERSKLFMPAMNTEPIVTPFGFTSTADDVIRGVDLAGKRAIVTGGASGIGIETARALASAGAEVTLAVRNVEAGKAVASDIGTACGRYALDPNNAERLWNVALNLLSKGRIPV